MWFLWTALMLCGPALGQTADRVFAEVGEQVLLASDVQLERELSRLDQGPLPLWRPARAPAEDRLIEAAIVRQLAGDVSVFQPPDADVNARLEEMRARFPTREAWQGFLEPRGLTEASLRQVLRRRMAVERYLTRAIQLSPDDEAGWLAAYQAVLDAGRQRVRVRMIPVEGT
ncbi:MAG: hypothetical protein JXX28_10190 [Deltaproteobacteria bacterium]|nr:hypothetical protein [Deltaproteobacteria bacterium]